MKRWSLIFGICLSIFTVFVTLDTFVLSSSYAEATQMNMAMFAEESEETESSTEETKSHRRSEKETEEEITENSETEDPIQITMNTYTAYGTTIYVADITLSSAEYLKTAFANDTYGKNVTAKTSTIAEDHDAILAINGDYYGVQESGYVIRNGVLYRDKANGSDVLCIYADGTMEVVSDRDYTAEELIEKGVWQAFSFGPGLVEDCEITVSESDEVGKAMASNPRTAIGIIDTNHFVFVVSDGRTSESEGLSLYQLATFMKDLGVTCAYNLDGGGSSTMVYQGEVINNPTTGGNRIKERGVSDIVYIG
ncbi:MAG: phosphodiester glycosidase family protein [Lachnospiraceae bacterium]|nr:phosphodiester glycosidase family protein [Lachnospiraceae bacterium]